MEAQKWSRNTPKMEAQKWSRKNAPQMEAQKWSRKNPPIPPQPSQFMICTDDMFRGNPKEQTPNTESTDYKHQFIRWESHG